MKRRLAIVLSHPIQHFSPLYATWAASSQWAIHVYFGSRVGADPYFDRNFGQVVSWSGLGLERYPHTFLNGTAAIPVTNDLDAISLDEQLDAFRPSAVLSYGYNQRLQRRAQSWARRRGVPIVFFSDGELRHRRPLWKRAIKALVVPRLFQAIDWFIVTGNANEEYYRYYGVPAARMLRGSYPIDRDAYREAYKSRDVLRLRARARLGVQEDEVVVAMVGKLVPWKRQIDLIAAVGQVTMTRAVAVLVGTGPMEEAWRKEADGLARNRAVFAGFTPSGDLPELYAAADIYVHTSSKEPHSVAVSEAVYMGLPVVISDRCGSYGMDDDVQHGLNGIVYSCGSIEQLASTLDNLGGDVSLRREMGLRSHEIGRRNQHVIYDEVLETLARVLDHGPIR